ncbi:hypothetical protein [Blastopirellula marina]|uniref:hypothetical protein n=1 Tax=Blastopirellula marina TaxID=124 RepID=UPI0011B02DB7|nr:hypothetical protein [Blastopirellula marina]
MSASEPDDVLRPQGFRPFGSRWVLREEVALKRDLDALEEIVRRTIPLKRQIELAVADNNLRWQKQQSANQLIDEIAAAMRRSAVGTDEEKKVQKQIAQLKKATRELRDGVAPDHLGGLPHMRAMLESMTLLHQHAAVLSVRIEANSNLIQRAYQQLPSKVSDWIKRHPEIEIGPLYRPEQVDLATRKTRAMLGVDEIPMFLQDKQKRIGVVLNDQFPCVLTVAPQEKRLIVTSNMALSAGITQLGPLQTIKLPGGQTTKAHAATIKHLRVGSAALHEVSALVLQPSEEHLGGVLGLKLIQAWNPQFSASGIGVSLDTENRTSTAAK